MGRLKLAGQHCWSSVPQQSDFISAEGSLLVKLSARQPPLRFVWHGKQSPDLWQWRGTELTCCAVHWWGIGQSSFASFIGLGCVRFVSHHFAVADAAWVRPFDASGSRARRGVHGQPAAGCCTSSAAICILLAL